MKKMVTVVTGWNEKGMFQTYFIDGTECFTIDAIASVSYTNEVKDGKAEIPRRRSDEGTMGAQG